MAIIQTNKNTDTKKSSFNNPIELDKSELKFLLEKMRTATYTGDEFEMFYNIWVKLTNKLEKDK